MQSAQCPCRIFFLFVSLFFFCFSLKIFPKDQRDEDGVEKSSLEQDVTSLLLYGTMPPHHSLLKIHSQWSQSDQEWPTQEELPSISKKDYPQNIQIEEEKERKVAFGMALNEHPMIMLSGEKELWSSFYINVEILPLLEKRRLNHLEDQEHRKGFLWQGDFGLRYKAFSFLSETLSLSCGVGLRYFSFHYGQSKTKGILTYSPVVNIEKNFEKNWGIFFQGTFLAKTFFSSNKSGYLLIAGLTFSSHHKE